ESEPRQEEIDVVSEIDDVLPPSNDNSDDEVDNRDLHVDNVIQYSEHEYSESEDSNLDNPLLPLPPPEPLDKEFDFEINFEKEISVERNLIVKFECIDSRMKFDVENDVFNFIRFSLLFAESEDMIFDHGYCPGFQDLCILCSILVWRNSKLPRGWRLAANDLCTRYCAGGGWTNWKMTRHHGTVAAVEGLEKSVRGSKKSVQGSEKNSTRFRKKSILEADVAQDDWWIKNITAANDEI
nr:hypothetical protein [Tanacetum cinerariifolium]